MLGLPDQTVLWKGIARVGWQRAERERRYAAVLGGEGRSRAT